MSVSGQSAGMALLLREGIDWVALVGSGAATREDHEGLMRWRALSPDHDAAWREAWALGHVMREVGRELIKEREAAERVVVPFDRPAVGRRAFLGGAIAASAVGAVLVGGSLDLLPAGRKPDFATNTGERRTVNFAQGLTLELDAQTGIAVDTNVDRHQVELLAGRAEVVAHLGNTVPVVLIAGKGHMVAREARFDVRRDDDQACVTCLEGHVRVEHGDAQRLLVARQQLIYTDDGIGQSALIDPAEVTAWKNGQLIFHRTPLSDVIKEVNRYRPGKVVIANAGVGRRPVNGIFHIGDMEAVIGQVQQVTGARATKLPGGVIVLS